MGWCGMGIDFSVAVALKRKVEIIGAHYVPLCHVAGVTSLFISILEIYRKPRSSSTASSSRSQYNFLPIDGHDSSCTHMYMYICIYLNCKER